jgi:hypothetical protein
VSDSDQTFFPPLQNRTLPPPEPAPYNPNPKWASLLAHLIAVGYVAEPTEPLPFEWQLAYQAVKEVRGLAEDRWEAFDNAIANLPQQIAMHIAVHDATPARENRMHRNRVIRNSADALAAPPQVDWLIEDLFIRPSLNVLVGDPGSKKTLLALDMATCLALGKPWLGRTTVPTPTLYLDEETGVPRLWSRINGVLHAHAATAETPFHFLSLSGYDLRDANEMGDLMQKVQEVHAGLLVIDALADVIRGGDENSVLSTYPVMNYLRHLAEFTHAAVLILHHTNKTGIFRGSSAISAAVDLMLSIESPANSTLIELRPLKTRDASPEPFSARIHFEGNKFWLTPEQATSQHRFAQVESAILDLLASAKTQTTPDLMQALDTFSPASIRQAIYDLKISGYIARVNGSKRGTVAAFQLTPKGVQYCQGTTK